MNNRVLKCDIIARLKSRIHILDGAMGTMIQRENLSVDDFRGSVGNYDILNITRRDIIEKIHKAYIEAGADIIETNTFNGTAISQRMYGCEGMVYDINLEGARIAKSVAEEAGVIYGKEVLVAGAIGPTNKMLSSFQGVKMSECGTIGFDDMDFESMVEAYMEQVRGLVDGGVDILLVETVYDALNAKAALCAISKVELEKGIGVPVMVSATIDAENGCILSGETLEELFASLSGYDILSFGLNCSFGVAGVMPFVEQLANGVFGGRGIPCFLSICPNAGLPDANGQYGELPDFTAYHIKAMAQKGLINIAGGCCGTTPEHIKAIKKALEGMAPRRVLSM